MTPCASGIEARAALGPATTTAVSTIATAAARRGVLTNRRSIGFSPWTTEAWPIARAAISQHRQFWPNGALGASGGLSQLGSLGGLYGPSASPRSSLVMTARDGRLHPAATAAVRRS